MAPDESDAAAFSRRLASLKRRGCNVLVVNEPQAADHICERMLGGHDLDRRHLFLSTTTSVDAVLDRHRPRRTDPSALGVVDAAGANTLRSTAVADAADPAAGPAAVAGDEWYSRVDDLADLDAIFEAVRSHLDRLSEHATEPAEIRFCVESLDPFLNAVDEEELFRFMHLLTSSVREANAMGHVHAAASVDDPAIATLEPLFDASIYVDVDPDGTVKQRWRLHESDLLTDWFVLDG